MIPEETESFDARIGALTARTKRPPLERGILWSAIGLAAALVLLLVLGGIGLMSVGALRTAGAVLTWLAAVLMLLAVTYAIKHRPTP
jgi:uncharacterized RDD family membrane protein YckC